MQEYTAISGQPQNYHGEVPQEGNNVFFDNAQHTIPRANNGMERFFRKLRRNVRKRTRNTNTGNILAQSGESLALF